jgi:hypothetical protein
VLGRADFWVAISSLTRRVRGRDRAVPFQGGSSSSPTRRASRGCSDSGRRRRSRLRRRRSTRGGRFAWALAAPWSTATKDMLKSRFAVPSKRSPGDTPVKCSMAESLGTLELETFRPACARGERPDKTRRRSVDRVGRSKRLRRRARSMSVGSSAFCFSCPLSSGWWFKLEVRAMTARQRVFGWLWNLRTFGPRARGGAQNPPLHEVENPGSPRRARNGEATRLQTQTHAIARVSRDPTHV